MQTIHFANLEMLYLLWTLPVFVGLFIFAAHKRRQALNTFVDAGIVNRLNTAIDHKKRTWKIVLIILAFTMIVFALVRPGWNPKPKTITRMGRDVVFVLDVSKSMLAEDLAPNRLERAKFAILDCLNTLRGDRVALVAFAGTAAVKCPLTLDYGFFRSMLDQITVTSINRGGTLIGDALRKVVEEVFDDKEKKYKDIILITDGEDQDSFPVEAAQAAGERGVRLLAVGLGDENNKQPVPITDENGQKTYLMYQEQIVTSKLDADTLKKMALATPGGKYIHMGTGYRDLGQDYRELIVNAEKKELESKTIETFEEKFQIFIGLAIMLLVIEFLLKERKKQLSSQASLNIAAGLLLLGTLCGSPGGLFALGMQDEISQGNNHYQKGQYQEALTAYDKATVAEPESPYIYFNKGLTAFRLEDYTKAKEYFEQAALKTKNLALETKVHYNLGNVAFKSAERQKDSDLEAAVKAYEEAVKHYQDALKLDPQLKDAAYNIEVTRLILKDLLDKLKKQQQEKSPEQKQQEEIVKKLIELIEKQTNHIEQNKNLVEAFSKQNTLQTLNKKLSSLINDQTNTKKETQALSRKIAQVTAQAAKAGASQGNSTPNSPTQPGPSPLLTAKEHVDTSVTEQTSAVKQLDSSVPKTSDALTSQEKSLDALERALAALSEPQDQQQGQQDQEQKQGQQGDQDKQPQDKEKNGDKDKQEQQAQAMPKDERAEDILNEEKENKEKREQYMTGGYTPVEKDW